MKSEYRWQFVLILVMVGATLISQLGYKPVVGPHELVSYNDSYERSQQRLDDFADVLLLNVEVVSVEARDRPETQLRVTFSNQSDRPVVLKKPDRVAFYALSGCRPDGIVRLFDKNKIEVHHMALMADCAPSLYTESDFVSILPSGSYAELHHVFLPGELFVNDLPAGKYFLSVAYSNVGIGYQIPFGSWPPEPASLSEQELTEWYETLKVVHDLNAWVGTATSDFVAIEIPDYPVKTTLISR